MKIFIKKRIKLIIILVLLILETFKISTDASSLGTGSKNINYNREAAREYALKWATSSNSKYYNYVNEGGDCTNFVSQVLRAGGLEFVGSKANATSIKSWFYYSQNLPNRTSTWTAAQPFALHFGKEYERAYAFKEYKLIDALENWDTIYESLLPGDIVQYARQNNIAFHSQAITDLIEKNRTIYFCQHSNSMEYFRKNGNLRYYLMGKPNDYNFYIYNIKEDSVNRSENLEIKSSNNLDNSKTEEDYRKELIEALDIIKLSLEDTRIENEKNYDEKTKIFIDKMDKRIEEVEFHINKRGKSSKELLDILLERTSLD
ncbi:amidase domain-containing protein [Clostridium sp. MB05]|uniref:amidase domain-containing protein n=1 Tax=Clostridium sp. MB05 TaxID=3376682 RepID=UPI003981AF0A